MSRAPTTVRKYCSRRVISDQPMVAKSSAIRQKTPMGASLISSVISFINASFRSSNMPASRLPACPDRLKARPRSRAKRMICSILPSAIAPTGLVGMMETSVSLMLVGSAGWKSVSRESIARPAPGCTTSASISAMEMARAVVNRYRATDLPATRPMLPVPDRLAAPHTSETNTKGTTMSCRLRMNICPPASIRPSMR